MILIQGTPSAPPFPGSPPDYYELVQERERETFLANMSRHHQQQQVQVVSRSLPCTAFFLLQLSPHLG